MAVALREFKYYELARITARDLDLDRVPLAATPEILERALTPCRRPVAAIAHERGDLGQRPARSGHGQARRQEQGRTTTPGFAVIGMGKLGSEELNYSSDVDLIYVCTDDAVCRSKRELDLLEHYTKIAEDFGRLGPP